MHVPLSQNLMTIRGIYVMAREPENSRLPSRPQQNLQHQTSPQPQTSALVPYSSQPPQQPSPQPHAHTAVQNLPQPHDQPRPSFRRAPSDSLTAAGMTYKLPCHAHTVLCAGPLYLQSGHPNIFDVWIEQVRSMRPSRQSLTMPNCAPCRSRVQQQMKFGSAWL